MTEESAVQDETRKDTMSNRAKEIAAIMATYEPGQVWQWKDRGSDIWIDCTSAPLVTALHEPHWNWYGRDYRRKPEPQAPKYRPWTQEEGVGMRVSGAAGRPAVVIAFRSGRFDIAGWESVTPEQLLSEYTQLDGSPCGVFETPTTN